METYRKNSSVTTEAQANALLDAMDDFVQNPSSEKPMPCLGAGLTEIWNHGERLEWEWDGETLQEYDGRIVQEAADANQLTFYQDAANLKAWKDAKIRPWRNQKLFEWIDETFIKQLLYQLTAEEITEREDKRQELLDWPHVVDFDAYKTDAEIEALKPSAPSYII